MAQVLLLSLLERGVGANFPLVGFFSPMRMRCIEFFFPFESSINHPRFAAEVLPNEREYSIDFLAKTQCLL
jgi:hypothetical protein